jgi:hypothetical protein
MKKMKDMKCHCSGNLDRVRQPDNLEFVNDAEDRSWREASYRQFLRDDTPEDDYGSPQTKGQISAFTLKRMCLWLAIWWLAGFVSCWLTPFWQSQSVGFQLADIIMRPLEWIVASSFELSVRTNVFIFASKSTFLGFGLLSVFGLALVFVLIVHWRSFLRAERAFLYALIIAQLLMALGGELSNIDWREKTALIVHVSK